jgi:hypothetical protein
MRTTGCIGGISKGLRRRIGSDGIGSVRGDRRHGMAVAGNTMVRGSGPDAAGA